VWPDALKASVSPSASPSGGIASPALAAGGHDVAALGLTPSGPAPLSPEAAQAAYDKFKSLNLRADVYYAYELVQKVGVLETIDLGCCHLCGRCFECSCCFGLFRL
jgi:hypothetical protein